MRKESRENLSGGIDRGAWEAALRELIEAPVPESPAKTAIELAEIWGKSVAQTQKIVRRLVAEGKAKRVTKPKRRIDGGVIQVTAYLLV